MILVPLFDLKFPTDFAASAVGTSNRRHQKRLRAMAEQSTALSASTAKRQLTARALLLGERIDLAGLERSDLISATPLAFRAGQEGYAVLFRYGAVVLIGLSVLEEDELIRSLQPRITGALGRREDEGGTIEVVADRDDQNVPGGPLRRRDLSPAHAHCMC